MKNLLLLIFLLSPACAVAGKAAGADEAGPEAAESQVVLQRPDAQKIMDELRATLKLSSRQEDRLAKAVGQKTKEFDRNLAELEKNAAEEKKWLRKVNENKEVLAGINSGMPDLIREYLDDEQRHLYDELLAARNKPAPAAEPAVEAGAAADGTAVKPGKKRRLVRRRKLPAGAPAAAPGEDDAGGVMVDKEPAAAPGGKKRVLRKKTAAPPPEEVEAPSGPAGAAPTGKEAPTVEEDAGSYP